MKGFVRELGGLGHSVKYIRLDNAGENNIFAKEAKAEGLGLKFEFTAPKTPQQNGVVERAFATLFARARAMFASAGFGKGLKHKLWAECFLTATVLANMSVSPRSLKSSNELFGDKSQDKIVAHLHKFGEVGYVANRKKIQAKLDDRATKTIFVGYAEDHAGDVFRMYDPEKKSIKLSRDVHWLDQMWGIPVSRKSPKPAVKNEDDMSDLSVAMEPSDPNAPAVPVNVNIGNNEDDDLMLDNEDTEPVAEDIAHVQDIESIAETGEDSVSAQAGEDAALDLSHLPEAKRRKVERVRKQLQWGMEEGALVSPVQSDYTEPATYKQAMRSKDKAKWLEAIEKEFKSIGERKVWTPVKLDAVPAGMKPFGTKWVFKKKDNGVFRARLVALGYNQIPGVDFTDRFSPVVHDMTWRVLLSVFQGQDKDWVAEQNDVETASSENKNT
eukprot:Pompholyxophrys_punicea_v1_NODE_28_length_5163_cov_5.731206.p2 type:complete len:441 gc:universal NODE_28_length_5163_cov_5.731206:1806-3128(+)